MSLGEGVNGNIFSPSSIGNGTVKISYSVITSYGCYGNYEKEVSVHSIPEIPNFDINSQYCNNDEDLVLSGKNSSWNEYNELLGNPSGGSFIGLTSNILSLKSMTPGSKNLTYQYINSFGCSNYITKYYEILPIAPVSIKFFQKFWKFPKEVFY